MSNAGILLTNCLCLCKRRLQQRIGRETEVDRMLRKNVQERIKPGIGLVDWYQDMKIVVAGVGGYVGLANAVLLAQHNEVIGVDIIPEKVDMINRKESPIQDKEIMEYMTGKELHLKAVTDGENAYREAELVIIATQTNYDPKLNFFDTSSVESVIEAVRKVNPQVYMVIKSTIPVGYIEKVSEKYHTDRILFSPEFLREGHALYDNLYPTRIIVGAKQENRGMIHVKSKICFLLIAQQTALSSACCAKNALLKNVSSSLMRPKAHLSGVSNRYSGVLMSLTPVRFLT